MLLCSESLLHWAEPTEYEFLHTYLACMFVISSNDSDPMNELAKLVHMQHSQQVHLIFNVRFLYQLKLKENFVNFFMHLSF